MPLLPNDPPRAAYVHVPFCRHRCGYCNFTLVAGRDDLIPRYLAALDRELDALGGPHELDTIYLGGGTPSHLPPDDLARLLDICLSHFMLAADAEFTIEANPLDLTPQRVAVLKACGVNRLSLGVQSFQNAKLKLLERDHSRSDLQHAIAAAFEVTPRISLDLIFAAPGETLDHWSDDLEAALATGAGHISAYGLTIEAGTAFYGRSLKRQLHRVPEELEADMYELAIDRFASAGIEQYEISNFARPAERSRHNETYWRGRSYFACGPGAASYMRGKRRMNHRSTTTWLQRIERGESPVAESEELSPEDRARERFVFGLRMLEGISRDEICEETGFDVVALVAEELQMLIATGLLEWSQNRLRLTRRGLLVSDSIWPSFLRM